SFSYLFFFLSSLLFILFFFFFFSSRRRHTRSLRDWSSDVCSSDLPNALFYQTARNFNQVDQRLDFDNEFHAGRHLLFRLKDSLDYTTGGLEPRANGDLSLPAGGSSNLNTTLFTPFSRQFANEASGEV